MAGSSKAEIMACVVVVILICKLGGQAQAIGINYQLDIVNSMGENLQFHCKEMIGGFPSTDMGAMTLPAGQNVNYNFQGNLAGQVEYDCDFAAAGFPAKHMRVFGDWAVPRGNCDFCTNCVFTVSGSGFFCGSKLAGTCQ